MLHFPGFIDAPKKSAAPSASAALPCTDEYDDLEFELLSAFTPPVPRARSTDLPVYHVDVAADGYDRIIGRAPGTLAVVHVTRVFRQGQPVIVTCAVMNRASLCVVDGPMYSGGLQTMIVAGHVAEFYSRLVDYHGMVLPGADRADRTWTGEFSFVHHNREACKRIMQISIP